MSHSYFLSLGETNVQKKAFSILHRNVCLEDRLQLCGFLYVLSGRSGVVFHGSHDGLLGKCLTIIACSYSQESFSQ